MKHSVSALPCRGAFEFETSGVFEDNSDEEGAVSMRRFLCFAVTLALAVFAATSGGCRGEDEPSTSTGNEKGRTQVNKEVSNPVVLIETSMGVIRVELWPDKAPATVENFLRYVDERHYDGLVFHRVMDGFMIQGGGMHEDMRQKRTHEPVANEASPGLRNERGTIAMARTSEINSATSQFFINLKYNNFLDQKDRTPQGFGYCVFGKVIDGMDVVDRIAKVRTHRVGQHKAVPVETVEIVSVRVAK